MRRMFGMDVTPRGSVGCMFARAVIVNSQLISMHNNQILIHNNQIVNKED